MFQDYPFNIPMNINAWCSNELFHIKFRFISPYQWMYIYIYIPYHIHGDFISHIKTIPYQCSNEISMEHPSLICMAVGSGATRGKRWVPCAELDESLGFKLQDLTKKEWFHHEQMWVNMIQPWNMVVLTITNGALTLTMKNGDFTTLESSISCRYVDGDKSASNIRNQHRKLGFKDWCFFHHQQLAFNGFNHEKSGM